MRRAKLTLPGISQRRLLALVPVILVLLIGALAYDRARSVIGDVLDVEHSHLVLEASQPLLTRSIDAETGQRAFLLTGDERFLEPYNGAHAAVEQHLATMRSLVADNPEQRKTLDSIESAAVARFALLDSSIARRRTGRFDSATDAAAQLLGKRKMDDLRAGIASLQSHERRLLAERHAAQQRGVRSASIVVGLAALAAILVSALINLAFSSAVDERDTGNRELREVNDDLVRQSEQLEMQAVEMESQAAELEATAEDLRSTNLELGRTTRAAEEARDLAEGARLRFESVLENLPDAASVFGSDWRWTYVNPGAKRILTALGQDADHIIGKNLWETIPELKGTKFETETRRAAREGKVAEYEEYLPDLDAWTENTIVPVGDAVMTFTRDITRKKREQEGAQLLADASRALGSTLDYEKTLQAIARLAVGDLADWCAVDLLDGEGKIRQVAVAHVDEARVKWARELNKRYPPDHSAPTGVGEVIRTGQPQIYPEISDEMLVAGAQDEEHLRISRELQIKSAIVVPMSARGRTLGALTLVSSDKGRRYGDEDLALAMELATRAAVAIDNAQLYRSALTASEAKSAFLGTMSHELRTPLNAIIGYQSLLREGIDGALNDAQLAHLARIRASADHLLGLIDEILTFGRLEAGKEVIQRTEAQLRPIIDEAVSMITPLAGVKGMRLRVEGEDATIFTDPGKVRQIILNLLSNAVKFSDEGEVLVRSRVTGEGVAIDVIDSGIGIATENQARIFDPFWQVEQRSTRRAGGTGLGLSVSRNLARLLGGEVSVKSKFEKGSTFTLTLPVSREIPGD